MLNDGLIIEYMYLSHIRLAVNACYQDNIDEISILVLTLLSNVKLVWFSQKTLTLETLVVAPIVPTLMDARVNCLYYVDLPPIYNLTDVNNQFQLVLRK